MSKIHFKKSLILVIMSVVMLSGCSSVIDLTSEEEDLIAEYAAGVVAEAYQEYRNRFNTVGNSSNVIIPTVTEPATEPATQNTPIGQENPTVPTEPGNVSTGDSDTDSTAKLVQNLEITGVEVTMLGFDVYEKYPEGAYAFTVDAASGKKLLVVEYDVWNSVDAPATMNVNTEDAVIKAIINDSKSVAVHKTLLNNDIMNMNNKDFEPGQAETGVLIFMIDDEVAAEIETVDIEVTKK